VKARDLAAPYPTVRVDSAAADAARILTEAGRPALVVVDEHDHPVSILPASQVLRLVIPSYIQDDPTLARVVDEDFADHMCDSLAGKTVAELLPGQGPKLMVVAPDDNAIEIAALKARNRSPLVAVVDGRGDRGPMIGAITVASLLTALLPAKITDPD
jgi:CBS-domain-containing membrane protein